ncbi:peptidase M20 domain-containing protein 2-like isoform X1 [Rhipicephalus microplus]|uniref:peptidase M20 domain-containing protein 2-like isoform X1 n=1 Tax=Rhipicephalus microplus TaxID=6941 RepID=UPI003F6BE7A3
MALALGARVHQAVESSAGDLWDLSQFLWANPETSMKEATAHMKLCDFLERKGFKVTRRYVLDTAFKAEFTSPGGFDGPTITFICEYDALPEIGHACGHNLVAECAVGAAIAVKETMKEFKNIHGKVVVLGTPGQENFGGKEILLQKGAFKEMDIALRAHPATLDSVKLPLAASQQITVQFQCSPRYKCPWEAASALDAAVASYVNIALLRQQVKPPSKITGVQLESGRNVIVMPETSRVVYHVRAPTVADLAELMRRVEACLEAAAESTDCSLVQEKSILYKDFVHNNALNAIYAKHARDMGVTFSDPDNSLVASLGAFSDAGNASQALPVLNATFSIPSAGVNHTRSFASAAGSHEAQKCARRATKLLALTALDLYTDPKLLASVKQEFQDWKAKQPPKQDQRRHLVQEELQRQQVQTNQQQQ